MIMHLHIYRVATDFLETDNITVLKWFGCSPELYPIEHLWEMCKNRNRVCQDNPQNTKQLVQAAT